MPILKQIKSKLTPLRSAVMQRVSMLSQGETALVEVEPLHTKINRRPAPAAQSDTTTPCSAPQGTLHITCPDPTGEDELRDLHQNFAQKLIRQEAWGEAVEAIRTADLARTLTPGAMPTAELMAYGARSDVVLAVEHALLHGRPDIDAPLLSGIEALETVLAENEDDYVIATIVAQTHMDLGWAWRGTGWDTEIADRNRAAFNAHFDRADEILAPFKANPLGSPLLASTLCSLMSGIQTDRRDVADRYQSLIDLNPHNPRPMRAMGTHMLPRWRGSYAELELEARRTASRTQNAWGAGAYTWVMFDAIACDDEACANLDVPFFIEGLHDILNKRRDPYIANLLAAYCANANSQSYAGNDTADLVRSQLSECTEWIVREHLTELHPMIWAHAARGFDNNLRIQSAIRFAAAGRDDALRVIKSFFKQELTEGNRIVFTEHGPVAEPI